ncbi:hypothetical protein BGZ76_004615 [Entomortierella beljakovae]|nr:hypothetical protein BGZ76_004615 [Entomortierella beljakovae]
MTNITSTSSAPPTAPSFNSLLLLSSNEDGPENSANNLERTSAILMTIAAVVIAALLPRSISPLLGTAATSSSVPSASSIRSLSPSRHTSRLRSRSSSPTPRRFASVLAYHAAPIENNGKRSVFSENNPYQQQSYEHEGDGGANIRGRGNNDRDESPSRIAFRNLEESWKRFELDSASTTPLSTNTTNESSPSSPTSPLSRPLSPSTKQPYKELIECASITESQDIQKRKNSARPGESDNLSVTLISQNHANNNDHEGQQGNTKSMEPPLSDNKKASSSLSTSKSETTIPVESNSHISRPIQGYGSAILSSNEARHILDLPSLLGRDPNMISEFLAIPFFGQPSHDSSKENNSSARPLGSNANISASNEQTSSAPSSNLISDSNLKAEKSAQAMTKQYSAKNLNMTETEAHMMVQMMAEEIVSLHEERNSMIQKLEQAKKEMLEAAQLLRARAAVDMENNIHSESQMQQQALGNNDELSGEQDGLEKKMAHSYDKDEGKS